MQFSIGRVSISGRCAACFQTLTKYEGKPLNSAVIGLRTIKRLLLMMSLPVRKFPPCILAPVLSPLPHLQLTFVISSIYWTLILMFPRLIMWVGPPEGSSIPTEIPEMWRIPLSMDLSLHAVPLIAVALDFLVFERKYTERQQRVHAPILTALYAVWYGAWVEWCASYNGTCTSYSS